MHDHTQTHSQLRKLSPLTARSSSLRCVSAAEHHTGEQNSKTGRTKPGQRYQTFQKLLWKPNEDASQKSTWNQMSQSISQLKLYSFIRVPPIVNACDWGYIVRDLEYHSLRFTSIQFHPQNGHITTSFDEVTTQGLCYCNSDAWGWHNSYQSVSQLHMRSAYSSEWKKIAGVQKEQ